MPVVEWDSYIVQRRDLIQHLIGHIDIDADLATRQPLMSSSQWCGAAGTQQHIIIKMEGVPRQNMSGQRSYRLRHRGGHQRSTVDVVGVAEQILQLLGRHVPLAQCTIFSFQGMARPRVVGMGDRARTGALPMISQDYSERFYPLDGSQRVMQAELAAARAAGVAQPRAIAAASKACKGSLACSGWRIRSSSA